MKHLKRNFISLFLAITLILSCTACGSNNSSPSGSDKPEGPASNGNPDLLTIVTDSDLGNMGPFGNGTSFSYMQDQVYQGLFNFGYNMEITPVLAESWDQVDDTHYTFHLREGLKDSENNPITAADVLFSMQLYATDASFGQYVAHIDFDKTTATDERTLDLYFSDTNAFAFSQIAGIRIVTRAAWEASPDGMVTKPIGSGPYKLKDYVGGSYFILEANENYWGEQPSFKEIRFNIVAEPAQRTTQLETGSADLVMNLQASDVGYIDGKDNLTVERHISTQTMTMFFNMDSVSVMSSKEMRQGVCYAIDNEAMNVAAYGGYCAGSTALFSTAMVDYSDDMATDIYTTSDADKAAELFAASGKQGGSIRIATDGSPQETTIAELLQSSLIANGFEVTIDSYDAATIWSVAADSTQWDLLLMITSAPSGYGLDKMTAFLPTLNFSKWSGSSFDQAASLMFEASNTVDEATRMDLTKQVLAIVEDEVPAYGIVQIAQNIAYRSNLNFKVWNQASLYAADLKLG